MNADGTFLPQGADLLPIEAGFEEHLFGVLTELRRHALRTPGRFAEDHRERDDRQRLTVRRLPSARSPMPIALASFVARTAVVLVGFYVVMGGRWESMLACLAGFFLVRLVMVRRMRAEIESYAPRSKELV